MREAEGHEDPGWVLPMYSCRSKNAVYRWHRIDVAIQGKLAGRQPSYSESHFLGDLYRIVYFCGESTSAAAVPASKLKCYTRPLEFSRE